MVTGGCDRVVRLWTRFVTTHPVATLLGHHTAVLDVAIYQAVGQIFSYSRDAVSHERWSLKDRKEPCQSVCIELWNTESLSITYCLSFKIILWDFCESGQITINRLMFVPVRSWGLGTFPPITVWKLSACSSPACSQAESQSTATSLYCCSALLFLNTLCLI